MSFIDDLVTEMSKVKTYDVTDGDKTIRTISCATVCDIITVLFDKYNMEERLYDDLHG